MNEDFARQHEQRAETYHKIIALMESLRLPQAEIIRIMDDIQNVEFINRKDY